MSAPTTLRWSGDALVEVDSDDSAEGLLAADSWLVDEGRVLALELHRERFAAAVAATDPTAVEAVDAFWAASIAELPRRGAWFPRVELRPAATGNELRLLLRPAPARARGTRLATHLGADPRTAPAIKGPDLAALMRLRAAARAEGDDDIVLLSPDGYLVETATAALLWWVGTTIVVPAAELTRVDSVTARAVIALALAHGVPVAEEHVTPAELDGLELWSLNALHGIRVVTHWPAGANRAELPGRAQLWRERLEALRHRLPGAPA